MGFLNTSIFTSDAHIVESFVRRPAVDTIVCPVANRADKDRYYGLFSDAVWNGPYGAGRFTGKAAKGIAYAVRVTPRAKQAKWENLPK